MIVIKNYKSLITTMSLMLVVLIGLPSAYSQVNATTYMVFDEGIAFRLPAYDTIIGFSEDYRLSRIGWDKWYASMIYFYNLSMDGDEVDVVGFSVIGANLTVVDLFVNYRLLMELDAPRGTNSTVVIYIPSYGKPTYVRRLDSGQYLAEASSLSELEETVDAWFYNTTTRMLHIKVSHQSIVPVMVSWESLTTTTTTTTTTTPPPEAPEKPWTTYITIIVTVLLVMALLYMSTKAARHVIYEERRYVKKKT